MIRLANTYAKALFSCAKMSRPEAAPQIAGRFLEMLDIYGHRKLLPHILHAIELLQEKERRSSRFVVTVANMEDSRKAIDEVRRILGDTAPDGIKITTDDTLIGGFTAETGSVFIDASHKQMLARCYKRIIAH